MYVVVLTTPRANTHNILYHKILSTIPLIYQYLHLSTFSYYIEERMYKAFCVQAFHLYVKNWTVKLPSILLTKWVENQVAKGALARDMYYDTHIRLNFIIICVSGTCCFSENGKRTSVTVIRQNAFKKWYWQKIFFQGGNTTLIYLSRFCGVYRWDENQFENILASRYLIWALFEE